MHSINFNACMWFILHEAPFTTTPMPSTLPLSCTFETGTECFLKDAGSDDFDWTVRSVWFIIYDIVLKCRYD